MALTSSIYDHFIIWPSSVTLTFNLREQMFRTALLLEDNNCAKLFWKPCINVPDMARTSSIYDHFDLYLTPMTLTFNLPEKMFQMALLLLEDNKCAKLFWNPCINVQVMAWTSSIYDHFDLYLTPVTLTFNLTEKMFQCTSAPWGQQLCKTRASAQWDTGTPGQRHFLLNKKKMSRKTLM